MKAIYNFLTLVFVSCCITATLASCEDFTDIQPKGENLLASTDDLELLLNADAYDGIYSMDHWRIGSNIIYAYSDVTAPLAVENKTRAALLNGYFDDEQSLKRLASLTNSDGMYTSCYYIIGRVCNPILNQLETATGPESKKNALKAEALVARAFCHYMVLQRFAPAFNGSNGDSPAIIYMTEDKDIMQLHEKNTIQECYDQMLKDVNDALAMNSLPSKAANFMRWDQTSALAVKALILMGMHNYAEAETAAKQVLANNNSLWDWWANVQDGMSATGVPYQYAAIDDRFNAETLFCIPSMIYYAWVEPSEWNAMEPEYGRRGLSNTMRKQYEGYIYYGMDYGDYGATIGLPGWEGSIDFDNQFNESGLNTPQMYLIVAECELRNGNIATAMNWLDQLRAKRLPEGFSPLEGTVTEKADAIQWLKKTVAAEFLWQDWTFVWRKRWNVESEWQTTLSHEIAGKTYTLRPDSKLWIFPFPVNATEKNSNLTNNW